MMTSQISWLKENQEKEEPEKKTQFFEELNHRPTKSSKTQQRNEAHPILEQQQKRIKSNLKTKSQREGEEEQIEPTQNQRRKG